MRIKNKFLLLIVLLVAQLIPSCDTTDKKIMGESLDNNEEAGVKNVCDFYGIECEYSIGKFAGINLQSERFFILDLRGEISIVPEQGDYEMYQSNAALIFYNTLKEKSKYSYIRVLVNQKHEKNYPRELLDLVNEKLSILDTVSELLENEKIDVINNMISDNFLDNARTAIVEQAIKDRNKNFGKVKYLQYQGFRYNEQSNTLILYGIEDRKKGKSMLTIRISLNDDPNGKFIESIVW